MNVIEKNIPLPRQGARTLYPLDEMSVGDACEVRAKSISAPYNMAKQASYRLAPKQFKGGRAPDGRMMVWRVK